MSIKIVTEKVFDEVGKKGRVVKKLSCLPLNKLPEDYLKSTEEVVFLVEEYTDKGHYASVFVGWIDQTMKILLETDEFISENAFQEALIFIRKAGDNLHKINKTWSGIERHVI